MTSPLVVRVTRPPPHPRPYLIVEVADGEGRRGQCDAAPLPPFSREDVGACERALSAVAGRLGALDASLPPDEAVAAVVARLGRDLDGVPSARLALEAALFDLVGEAGGLSAASCLRGGAAPAYDSVPVNALLAAEPLETLPDRAVALAVAGFPALKIKLRAAGAAGFARELAALRALRERLPLPYEIRLDPNGAWSLDEARRRLDALAPVAPAYVEQPVAAPDLHRLGACAVPWAADESLAEPALVDALLSSRGCAAFVLKPPILGGLARSRALALRAQERGIGAVVTHFRDGPFALAAACALALSLPRPPLACGLAPHEDLDAFAEAYRGLAVPQLAQPGTLTDAGGPGLGVRSTWVCELRG